MCTFQFSDALPNLKRKDTQQLDGIAKSQAADEKAMT